MKSLAVVCGQASLSQAVDGVCRRRRLPRMLAAVWCFSVRGGGSTTSSSWPLGALHTTTPPLLWPPPAPGLSLDVAALAVAQVAMWHQMVLPCWPVLPLFLSTMAPPAILFSSR
eukprot:COSAG01_NODE_3668_length_5811_cov_52.307598_10_plen_114_part_00